MICCGQKTYVVDAEYSKKRKAFRRRRICKICGKRYTTFEVLASELNPVTEYVYIKVKPEELQT